MPAVILRRKTTLRHTTAAHLSLENTDEPLPQLPKGPGTGKLPELQCEFEPHIEKFLAPYLGDIFVLIAFFAVDNCVYFDLKLAKLVLINISPVPFQAFEIKE
ncbi:MAG: hypothetical protein ACREDR_37335 [Blastocatellia bacterium]